METREKRYIQLKYGVCLQKIISDNKASAKINKANGTKDHKLVSSLRKLEAASGISFPIIQSISKGNKNPALTTVIALAEGLGMTATQFFTIFDSITEEEIKAYKSKKKSK